MKNGSNGVWASTRNWHFAMTNSNAEAPTEKYGLIELERCCD